MRMQQTGSNIGPDARVVSTAPIGPNTCVTGCGNVSGEARLTGHASVEDRAILGGCAELGGTAMLIGDAVVTGRAVVDGRTVVCERARVREHAHVGGNSRISGHVRISGDAVVMDADISGNAHVGYGARINDSSHVIVIDGMFEGPVTVYRTGTGHAVTAGCQTFTLNDPLEQLAHDHAWRLPAAWKPLRDALLMQVAAWH